MQLSQSVPVPSDFGTYLTACVDDFCHFQARILYFCLSLPHVGRKGTSPPI